MIIKFDKAKQSLEPVLKAYFSSQEIAFSVLLIKRDLKMKSAFIPRSLATDCLKTFQA